MTQRLIDADALINEAMERYCSDCEQRKGVKNGKWKIVYSIGDAPCRACGVGDMIEELEDAPTIEPEPQWISCDDTVDLPEHEVLCCDRYGAMLIGWLLCSDDQWLCESDNEMMYDPVAWMPLPEPARL